MRKPEWKANGSIPDGSSVATLRTFYSWKLHLSTVSRDSFFPDESTIFCRASRVPRIAVSIYCFNLTLIASPILLVFSSTRYFSIIIYHSSGFEDLCFFPSRLDALACEFAAKTIVRSLDEKIERGLNRGPSCAKKSTTPVKLVNEKAAYSYIQPFEQRFDDIFSTGNFVQLEYKTNSHFEYFHG